VKEEEGKMFLLILLALTSVVSAADYCSMSGCANVTTCTCYPFFFDCIVQNDKAGVCTMTESGTWITIVLVIAMAIAICLLILLVCCCCCCKYKGSRVTHHHHNKDGGIHSV